MEPTPLQASTVPAGATATAIDTALLHTLFGHSPRGMLYCRMEYAGDMPEAFTVLYANTAFTSLSGREALGKRFSDLCGTSGERDEALLQTFDRVVRQGEKPTFERYVESLGKWLLIDAHSPIPGHFILVLSDVSSKRRAEAEVAASEKRLRAIFEICPVPFCLNDTLGNITFLNKAFKQTFGYTVEDIPTLEDWWPNAYPDPVYREWVGKTGWSVWRRHAVKVVNSRPWK